MSRALNPCLRTAKPFESKGKKRALLVAVRGVVGPELPHLEFTHRDAKALSDFLIDVCGFHPDDITLMVDDERHLKDLWPTHHNILQQIGQLTRDVPEDCHVVFYCASSIVDASIPLNM